MSVNKITSISLQKIKDNSAASLPDAPSKYGYSPETIRKKFWQPIVGTSNSLANEINRIVDEINNNIDELDSVEVSETEPTTEGVKTWLDTSNKDIHFSNGVYVETENIDQLFEVDNPYDDEGNYIGG